MHFTRLAPYALSLSLLSAACGGPLKYKVASTAKAPGADATIVADVRKNEGRTDLELKVVNLPPASRVCGGAYFVAWQNADKRPWARLSALALEGNARESEVTMTVPETSFNFQITCERENGPSVPSNDVIFSQTIN